MRPFYSFILSLAKAVLKVFYRLKVYGTQHCHDENVIIAPNHASYLDPPLIACSWPYEIHFMAAAYLFKIPLFSLLIKKLNAHPINQGKADLKSIKMICQLLSEGKQVLIFPEGSRTSDGHITPLKPGLAMIALRAKSSIVPAYIHGSFQAWRRGQWFPKPWGKTAVVFGTPLSYEEFSHLQGKDQQKALLDKLEQSILNLRDWYLNGAAGSPP